MLTRTFCSLARVSSRLPAITPVVYQTQRTYAKKPDNNNNNKGTGGPAKTGSSGVSSNAKTTANILLISHYSES